MSYFLNYKSFMIPMNIFFIDALEVDHVELPKKNFGRIMRFVAQLINNFGNPSEHGI